MGNVLVPVTHEYKYNFADIGRAVGLNRHKVKRLVDSIRTYIDWNFRDQMNANENETPILYSDSNNSKMQKNLQSTSGNNTDIKP